jgi:2Fe-2S ferredoxin
LPDVDPQEESMLGLRPDRGEDSRLGCQVVVSNEMGDLTVKLPEFQM